MSSFLPALSPPAVPPVPIPVKAVAKPPAAAPPAKPADTPPRPAEHSAPHRPASALSPRDIGYVDSLMGLAPAQTMEYIMLKTGVPMPANLGQDIDTTA